MTIKETVDMQREFFLTGATKTAAFRIDTLKRLQNALKNNEKLIAEAINSDFNKHPEETYMCETGITLDELRFHIKHLPTWAKNKKTPTPIAQFHAKSFISPEHYGVVFIISSWNYPIQLCIEPLIGAISAGNCAVVKPSAYAPESSHIIAKLIGEVFDSHHVAVIEGGRQQDSSLLEQKFDYIFFTGSIAVGKTVMEAAAKNLSPITLELGGKSPVIVDSTANIKLAAKRVAFGKVLNAGQTCVEPDYLFIHESIKDAFVSEYKRAPDDFFPNGDMRDMPVIVSEKHFARLVGLLERQKALIGGKTDPSRRFIEPTLLDCVSPDSPVMSEEIFGPILPVMTFHDITECIGFIQSRPKPLALYLFTEDKSTERRVLAACSFGGGCINDTMIHLATFKMPFGGVGYSGMGSYHGIYSFDTYTHYRSIVKNQPG